MCRGVPYPSLGEGLGPAWTHGHRAITRQDLTSDGKFFAGMMMWQSHKANIFHVKP